MPTRIRDALAIVSVFVLAACASLQRPGPISVCDILAAPENFDGTTVSVRGIVDTDYFEFSGIADANCYQSVISFSRDNRTPGGLDELLAATESVRGEARERVEVTVHGTVAYRPTEVPFLVIDAVEYSDIDVVPYEPRKAT
jgi:hypothetical protein